MTDLCRTTIIQAFADLICLVAIFILYRGVQPTTLLLAYYVTKVAVFSAYRFGGTKC